jgi:hypothetical protein
VIRVYPLAHGVGDVTPEAIFWRPIHWFASELRQDDDDLDRFHYVTYEIGNWLRFDLRIYDGHPPGTTTLYLGFNFGNPADVQHAITRAVEELHVPKPAVAWRRGMEFEYGTLSRDPNDRLREPEARLIALKVAALMPNRTATTEQLIDQAVKLCTPSSLDLELSRTRERQPQWHQIMRNVISHRNIPSGPFSQGLAVRTNDGLSVTDAGIQYLQDLGFIEP